MQLISYLFIGFWYDCTSCFKNSLFFSSKLKYMVTGLELDE